MIVLHIVTAKGPEKKTFHSHDHAMIHINGRKDILGYRAVETQNPRKKKVEEL